MRFYFASSLLNEVYAFFFFIYYFMPPLRFYFFLFFFQKDHPMPMLWSCRQTRPCNFPYYNASSRSNLAKKTSHPKHRCLDTCMASSLPRMSPGSPACHSTPKPCLILGSRWIFPLFFLYSTLFLNNPTALFVYTIFVS